MNQTFMPLKGVANTIFLYCQQCATGTFPNLGKLWEASISHERNMVGTEKQCSGSDSDEFINQKIEVNRVKHRMTNARVVLIFNSQEQPK